MKPTRALYVALTILASQSLYAQWRLIYKSQDIDSVWAANKTNPVDTVNPVVLIEQRGKLSKYLIVRYAHSSRELVPIKSVWGFTDSTDTVWRYSDGDMCRVIDYNDAGVKYAIYRTAYKRNSGQPYVYYETGYSRTLDSKIETSWAKAMERVPPGYILR